MKSEHLLAKTVKEMMATQPVDTISVIELSKKCGISRKTFYYHFHDIYDLLTQVFLDEKIIGVDKTTRVNNLVELVWKYYQDNEGFINATLQSAGKDLFLEFIYNNFYVSFMRFINLYDDAKLLQLSTKKAIARFYASGYSNAIVYYLSTYKHKTYKGLCECVWFIDEENFKRSLANAFQLGSKI